MNPCEWQSQLPGRGWSSPIVVGNSVWLTAAEVVGLPDAQSQAKLEFDPEGPLYFQTHAAVAFILLELNPTNGKLRRKIDLFKSLSPPPIHGMNSYASPTPTGNDRLIVCHFGSLGTVAVDRVTGEILWKKVFPVEDITGPGSSPILHENLVIIANDGADEQAVFALHQQNGEMVWKAPRPPMQVHDKQFRRAFSTPVIVNFNGEKQLLSATAQWMVSYNPDSGSENWRCRIADGYSLVPQPAYADGTVYVATGFMKPELWAIRIDGSSDVGETHVVWKSSRQAPELASPIIVDDALYTVSSRGILSCLARSTGEVRWQQRLSGTFVASPVYVDGKIFIVNQSGVTYVVQPGDKYVELGRNETFGETQATPAITGDRLLIRTDPILYSIRAASPRP